MCFSIFESLVPDNDEGNFSVYYRENGCND